MDKLEYNTRLSKITLENFKNIEYGTIDFPNANFEDFFVEQKASVLGIYGQNGSGKSSLVSAIRILKQVLSGKSINRESDKFRGDFSFEGAKNLVKVGCDRAKLSYSFVSYDNRGNYFDIQYNFELLNEENRNTGIVSKIDNETIEYSMLSSNGEKIRKKVLLSTRQEYCAFGKKAFGTKQNTVIDKVYSKIVNNKHRALADKEMGDEWFIKQRQKLFNEGFSFFFGHGMSTCFLLGLSGSVDVNPYLALMDFSDDCYIIGTRETGNTNLNMLPLYLPKEIKIPYLHNNDIGMRHPKDYVLINLNNIAISDADKQSVLEPLYVPIAIKKISLVLEKIIPGLQIVIDKGVIYSQRGDIKIPLGLESDGVKRLVSISATLIAVFNNPSIMTIIDELDSGIFEDLLGNILRIFEESAKGQLVFTSHNLRPLEVLPTDSIRFTTTNPKNRFFKMTIKGNSNLRDSYRRALHVGGVKEKLYNDPDNTDIKLSFMQE